jgi:hypothetical protein
MNGAGKALIQFTYPGDASSDYLGDTSIIFVVKELYAFI